MKRLKIREDSWDSWRLEESTKPDHIKIFNSLKKGDKVEINYDSAMQVVQQKHLLLKQKIKSTRVRWIKLPCTQMERQVE